VASIAATGVAPSSQPAIQRERSTFFVPR